MSRRLTIGALGAMLDQGQAPCVMPDGRTGWSDGNTCYPIDPNDPNAPPGEPQIGPGGQPLPPGFVAPGPTELHPDRWDLDACMYTPAYGDTYVGLAKTYLDSTGARWREIWNLNRDIHPNPDLIDRPDAMHMPEEACQNMRRWLNHGGPKENPSQIKPTVGDSFRKYGPWLALGGAVVGLWWMS